MRRKVWIFARRRRALVGLVLLVVLIVAGTLIVRRSDSSLVVRTIDVGAAAVAVDEQAGNVVVAGSDRNGGHVNVLDARTGAILRTVSVRGSGGWCILALDERLGRAFVTFLDYYGHPADVNMVDTRHGSVLETRSGRVVRTVAIPQEPYRSVVAIRSGRVFILGYSDQSPHTSHVTMLGAQSGRVLRTVTVGVLPQAMAVDEMTRRVFIMNTGDLSSKGSISALDARSGALLRTVMMPDEPETLAVDPRHRHIFVASEHRDRRGNYTGPGSVLMLDARTGQVLHTVEVDKYPNAMAVDERNARVFVATVGAIAPMLQNMPMEGGSVSVLDARSGRLLRTIPVGVAPSAIAVDERAGRAVILNSGGTWEDKGGPDIWRWVPAWIRQHLPFLCCQQQKTRLHPAPAGVSVIDTTRWGNGRLHTRQTGKGSFW